MSFRTNNPLSYLGVKSPNPPLVINSNRNPLTSDLGYDTGSIWVNVPGNAIYMLSQNQDAMAVWVGVGGGSGDLNQLTGNTGTATPIAGSIAVTGVNGIFTTGSAGALSLTPVTPFSILNSQSNHSDVLQVINSATGINADTLVYLAVNGNSAGDPYIQFTNGPSSWVVGLDNSDSDKFKISYATYPGTNDFFVIDTSGNITLASLTLSGLTVNGATTLNGTLQVNGATTQNGAFTVSNVHTSTFTGTANFNSLVQFTAANLNVQGAGANLRFLGIGSGLFFNNASDCTFGTATLASGFVSVSNAACTTSSTIFLQRLTVGGSACGFLASVPFNGSFQVTSYRTNNAVESDDGGSFAYLIIQHP